MIKNIDKKIRSAKKECGSDPMKIALGFPAERGYP
jgi:hypothetical protein